MQQMSMADPVQVAIVHHRILTYFFTGKYRVFSYCKMSQNKFILLNIILGMYSWNSLKGPAHEMEIGFLSKVKEHT
jgi:hypothetical protein